MKNKAITFTIYKSHIVAFVIGAVVFSSITGVIAYSYSAKDVTYTPKDRLWDVSNTSDAIDSMKYKLNSMDSFIYSTEEKVIGRWLDGRPLYQKTISFQVSSVNTQIINSLSSFGINNMDSVRNVYGYQEYNGDSTHYLPIVYAYANGDRASFWIGSNNIYFISTYTGRVYATLQYTKSTD